MENTFTKDGVKAPIKLFTNFTRLQQIAVANMDLVIRDMEAVAFENFKPAHSLKKIYKEYRPVTRDNYRMVLSALDDWGLVSDADWDKLTKEFRNE